VSFYRWGADVIVESDWKLPSILLRCVGIAAAARLTLYGFIGVMRNELAITRFELNVGVMVIHGALAWLCFTGIMMMTVGIFRLLGPPFGDGTFDFEERRHRFGWIVLIGVGLFAAPDGINAP
jgi:hypothetical protein